MNKKWENNLEDFIKEYQDKFDACFMVGSLVYQKKFSESSDIDLIIVMNSLDDWKYACKNFLNNPDDFILETINLYKKNEVQYFCLKFKYKRIWYSIDFVLKDFFDKAINDLNKKGSTVYYKITNKEQKNNYEFGYKDQRISVKKENIFYKKSVSVSSPLCIIKNDNFYFGIILDKLIMGYICLWNNRRFDQKINQFCLKAIFEWMSINKNDRMKNVIQSLNRIKLLPKKHIEKQILRYEKQIKD